MRVHKEIIVDENVLKEVLQHEDLIRDAKRMIENYNNNKDTSISYTFSGNSVRINSYGNYSIAAKEWFDSYFIDTLGMKDSIEADWDNKAATKWYFFEE
jgi:hypothetical protein